MTTQLTWKKSSYSGAHDNCVEVARLPEGHQAVRDSKERNQSPIVFALSEWTIFVQGLRGGDLHQRSGPPSRVNARQDL